VKFCCSLAFGDPTHFVELAKTAEECGWDVLMLSDHVVHPEKIASSYPYTEDGAPRWEAPAPWPDAWVAIAAMAAVTSRIRFMTSVYVLPLRNPFVVAKAVGTAAVMSGGRIIFGVGAGWMEEEFLLLEQGFRRRGARMDEMITVLRKLWAGGMTEHHGEFYDFDRLQMSPAVSQRIPIYSGGLSPPALRRVGRVSDGWISDLHSTPELVEIVARLRAERARFGREQEPLDVVAACTDAVDLAGYQRLEEIGVSHLQTMPWVFYGLDGDTLAGKQEGLRRFAEDIISRMS